MINEKSNRARNCKGGFDLSDRVRKIENLNGNCLRRRESLGSKEKGKELRGRGKDRSELDIEGLAVLDDEFRYGGNTNLLE